MPKFPVKILSTFFYIGYLPLVPGTFASIAGLLIFFLIKNNLFLYTSITLLFISLGLLVCGRAERIFSKKDAKYIVIDEISGMLLSLIFIPYYNIKIVLVGFVLFRILDVLKPYPASKIQNLTGSLGVMGDDIIAALYTNIILQLLFKGHFF
jgi:phosphatidylglycerophosphatase A